MEALALEVGIGAVKFMVESFMQQLDEQKGLVGEAPKQVAELEEDLNFLKDYLKEAVKKPKGDSLITRTLLREVRNSVYNAEDAIDSFVIQVAESDSKCFSGAIPKSKLVQIAELIKIVSDKVKKIREKVEQQITNTDLSIQNEGSGEYEEQGPPGKRKYAPVFAEEEKRLRERLAREVQQPDTIFITGMHGVGKTALAAKMFHDPDIRKQFTKHIWVSVSNPTARNICLVVLRQLNKLPADHGPISRNVWELSEKVADCLEGEKLLIVVDNVSELQEWETLKSALERSDRRSKVLITSNNDETARLIVRNESPVKLNPLSVEDSWVLLQWEVFQRVGNCPSELVNHGKLIAGHCNGLPQAIVFAGVTLNRKDSPLHEMTQRKETWQQVSLGMITYFNEDMGPRTTSILSSYNRLPYHLRACFLYLGIFPQHSKFSVSKLIRMWIAEGFIRPSNGVALEKTAEDYLMYLKDRNLVIIEERRPDGSAKTCSVNELLYDFCKTEAGKERENFLQEFRKSSADGAFNPPINEVESNRRVCIHSHISNFIPRFISSRHHSLQARLRSFVSHSDEEFTLHSRDISNIWKAFKLLRVLDAKPMKFKKIQSDLCQLLHLRFVTLSLNGDVLHASISKLERIQTLIVHTKAPTLEIKADILMMAELRHFKTNASATLPKKSKASESNERLQTLCGISPRSCTKEFFSKTPNLKNLGIHGPLALLLDNNKNELLRKLVKIEKLKLLNYVTSPKYEGRLGSLLLQPSRLPPNLKSLTLSATCIDWVHISILESLQKLEELKLKNNAFVGDNWEMDGQGFPNLETLQIESLDFVQWKSTRTHFPKLRRLVLSKCKSLREIPIQLADIPTFRELHLRNGNQSAAECAQTIRAEKLQMKQNDDDIVFKLSFED